MLVKDKVVFVTGGANGIGAGCSRVLLENGAKVVVADVDVQKGEDLVSQLEQEFGKDRVIFVKCDVSDAASFTEAFQKALTTFNQVDIMFNNAGIGGEDRWESLIAVNLKGVIIGSELALAHMRKDKGGRGGIIINTASDVVFAARIYAPVYVATKYGVIGFTRSLACDPDRAEKGVRYACICPDATETTLVDDLANRCREGTVPYVQTIMTIERMSTRRIAAGLLSLVEDDDSNDTVLEINLDGMNRKKFIVENM